MYIYTKILDLWYKLDVLGISLTTNHSFDSDWPCHNDNDVMSIANGKPRKDFMVVIV
jgi:hypothetical protein